MITSLVNYLHQQKTGPSDDPKRRKRLNIALAQNIYKKKTQTNQNVQAITKMKMIYRHWRRRDRMSMMIMKLEKEAIPDSSGGCDTGDFIIINTKLIREIDFILLKLLKCQTLN